MYRALIHKLEMFIVHHKFLLKSARNREHKNFIHKIIRQRSRMVVIDKQNINIGQKVYENDGNNLTTSQYIEIYRNKHRAHHVTHE